MIARLKDTLLLVGSAASGRADLRAVFEDTFDLLEAESVSQARMLLAHNGSCIAAVLADLPLTDEEGIRALSRACRPGDADEIPLLLTIRADGCGEQEQQAFALGASDVISFPYAPSVVRRRVQVLVDLYLHKWRLQKLVDEQNRTIRNANQVMLDALSAIIEHRSTESGNHILRIRTFTRILLQDVAQSCPEYGLTERVIDLIAGASALHDIGKISIPDAILNKPGRLTDAEYEVIRTHTTVGGELIRHLDGMGDPDYLRYAYNIALYHHERWDGRGYPFGLSGEDIPICAQVAGIADVFDALTSPRVYKPALPYEQAIHMILHGECGVFSPKLLECFKHVRRLLIEQADRYADGDSPKDDNITLPLPPPAWKTDPLDTNQLSLVKYQALMHYLDDTVIEMDLDTGLYHLVYNPDPDLDALFGAAGQTRSEDLLRRLPLHPDDRPVLAELESFLAEEFFLLNLRRRTFHFRLYSAVMGGWLPYALTFLRINTGNAEQRIVTVIFHHETVDDRPAMPPADLQALMTSPALHGLVCSVIRCRSDREMTIDAGLGNLYSLTGFTPEELLQHFDGKLKNLIHPDDYDAFADALGARSATDRGSYHFRLRRKDGRTVWVLDKTRAHVEADEQEYFYHVLRDDTHYKEMEQQLHLITERGQMLIEQSGGIVFDWDLRTDTMYCSPQWERHFGYVPVSQNYGEQMGIATHFHPDDLTLVREAIRALREHRKALNIDVRIANSGGKYLWTRISASVQEDEQQQPRRILGILQDIDAVKRASIALKEQAERDPLTRLLNKASTQSAIEELLGGTDGGGLSALLVLDLDNFKAVNDNYGHLYGDAVLTKVAQELKRFFRAQDVIGRIGGDEFVVFLQNIPGEDTVRTRCGQLVAALRDLLEQTVPGRNVSCSVGAALCPTHGTGYNDLFRHADEALYTSKKKGKNTYTVYDPKAVPEVRPTHAITRIDSDEQPGMANASFVRYVFRRLYESRDIPGTIGDILAYAGGQLGVSRVYIFENDPTNTLCSNTFEWCADGVTPELGNLQNVSYETDIAGWQNVFNERGVFYCPDITTLQPHFRAILEPQGIKSMLQCALLDKGVFRGYIGFDDCAIHRLWTQEQIDLLQFLAEIMSLFLFRHREKEEGMQMGRV